VQPTLAKIHGRKELASGSAHPGLAYCLNMIIIPRMHHEIVLPWCWWKINHKRHKLATTFVFIKHTCITHNTYWPYMFWCWVYH